MTDDEPQPRPLRFFGTTWAGHGPAYWARRAAVTLGALLAAAAGALLMRLALSGVLISGSGSFVNLLLGVAVVVCSCMAAFRTWKVLTDGKDALTGWMADDKSLGPILIVGFVGALAAYFVRSLAEAPGESRERARYDAALARHRQQRTTRSGNPAARRPAKRRR